MRIIRMLCATVAVGIIGLSSVAFAADNEISITDTAAKDGRVSINVTNNTQEEILVTVTLEKQDENLSDIQRFYAIRQNALGAGETREYGFVIPDDKDGIPGSGYYVISAQNRKNVSGRQSVVVDYADSNEIKAFIDKMKAEVDAVGDEEPYERLLPVLEADDSKGIFFSVGMDHDSFMELDEKVRQQIANLIYYNEDTVLSADKFQNEFSSLISLGIYNSGDKDGGINSLNPMYDGKPANEALYSKVTDMMEDEYSTNEEFVDGFKIAYGLETVNRAKMSTIENVLCVFRDETGACESNINKIMKLSDNSKDTAFETIVRSVANDNVTTEDELDELLKKAYSAATKNNTGGTGGGGGGGGSMGSVSNKSENKQSSVSSAIGSGTVDTKVETTYIFTDLPAEHWAAESVEALKNAGIINGNEEGAFEPERSVTREEFAKMLVAACGFELETTSDFADVDEGAWYVSYIGSAVKNGIVKGLGDGTFGVGETITRQDMAVMTKRAVEAKGIEIDGIRDYNGFADEEQIADYAESAVRVLYEGGIINGKGDGLFDPSGYATRAEAAKIIYEAMKGGV